MTPFQVSESRFSTGFRWRTTALGPMAALLLCACPPSSTPSTTGTSAGSGEDDSTPTAQTPPASRRDPVTDTYHGVQVSEDYRWLEDAAADEVKAWTEAQNEYARKVLDAHPRRDALYERTQAVLGSSSVRWRSPHVLEDGRVMLLKFQPPKQQPMLVVLPGLNTLQPETVLFDPNEQSASTHIDWFVPSPQGDKVAVSISEGGTESGDVTILDAKSGEKLFETIPRVQGGTAGGSLAWVPDGKGFYYTRYPRGKERPEEDMNFYQQLYFHRLGGPTCQDRYELGKDLPRIAEIQVDVDSKSGRALATVQKGDGGEFALYLKKGKDWIQFSQFGDKTLSAAFGPDDDLYLLSRANAPKGKVMHIRIDDLPDLSKAQVTVAEGEDTLVNDFWGHSTLRVTSDRLYVQAQLGGPSELRVFDLKGKPMEGPKLLDVCSVSDPQLVQDGKLLFSMTSFLEPMGYYLYDPASKTTTRTQLVDEAPLDVSNFEVRREFATSKDGTMIPVNLILSQDFEPSPTSRAVLYGYGGYGVNITPRFNPRDLLFVDQGYVYAIANLRGGGEYGERWHRQGALTNKQNVFDDFAAALDHLASQGYAQPDRTGILGGSNGGLLMGATMVQHLHKVGAVVSFVGIYDMLRVELSPNGAFNVTEFGTVKKSSHFKALYAYSPYHNVDDDTAYPPVLFITGENDPRVDPMQSRKMTARLQQASQNEVLLHVSKDAGHGRGTALEERIKQYTDMYVFYDRHIPEKTKPETADP